MQVMHTILSHDLVLSRALMREVCLISGERSGFVNVSAG